MPEPVDPSHVRSSDSHLVSIVANGVNAQGVIVEWIVECYTEGCGFWAGPSGDIAMLEEIRDKHLKESRG